MIAYTLQGTGVFKTALMSKLPNDVASFSFTSQALNTFSAYAERYDVGFSLGVKDMAGNLAKGVSSSAMKKVRFLECLGGKLVWFDAHVKSGFEISRGKEKFKHAANKRQSTRGLSNIEFFERLGNEFNTSLKHMVSDTEKERYTLLSDLFEALKQLWRKLMEKGLINDDDRKEMKRWIEELQEWRDGEKILEGIKDGLVLILQISKAEDLNWLDCSVWMLEKRCNNNRTHMSLRIKFEILRAWRGQSHSISKFKYRHSDKTFGPRRDSRKIFFCAKCNESIIGKSNLKTHVLISHLNSTLIVSLFIKLLLIEIQ